MGVGLSPTFLGDAGHSWDEGRDGVGRDATGRPPAWAHEDWLEIGLEGENKTRRLKTQGETEAGSLLYDPH